MKMEIIAFKLARNIFQLTYGNARIIVEQMSIMIVQFARLALRK